MTEDGTRNFPVGQIAISAPDLALCVAPGKQTRRRSPAGGDRSALVEHYPRITALASASPPHRYSQEAILAIVHDHTTGSKRELARLFGASGVAQRHSGIDLESYYNRPRTTAERMATYEAVGYRLGYEALAALPAGNVAAVTDLFVVSCTGYSAPGLDIMLARDLGMAPTIRRTCIGHMGCFGALVGLRQAMAAVRANPGAMAALLSVELCSLHFQPTEDLEALTSFALFGDAAAALALSAAPEATGPAVVAVASMADYAAADQMSWTITDQGFVMGLSPRVPVTLRRNARAAVATLLAPHDLDVRDIDHWIIHPGGPSILEAIQRSLELSADQMAPSWQILRDHGNCSSATVLLILEELLRSGQPQSGEWGVMMAFGPGLTLEMCLLRF
jgi:predicted naringenin-chalcone synthase